jgi:hypothetical protein
MAMTTELTPTLRKITDNRRAFHASIAARAAKLNKQPDEVVAQPKPIPAPVAEPEPIDRHWFEILDEQVYSIAKIQQTVAKYYGITRRDILSCRRTKDVVFPRQIAVYLAKELTPFSLPVLGRHFGGRDHSTQHHSIEKISKLLKADEQVAFDVAYLFIEITGTAQ